MFYFVTTPTRYDRVSLLKAGDFYDIVCRPTVVFRHVGIVTVHNREVCRSTTLAEKQPRGFGVAFSEREYFHAAIRLEILVITVG